MFAANTFGLSLLPSVHCTFNSRYPAVETDQPQHRHQYRCDDLVHRRNLSGSNDESCQVSHVQSDSLASID
jgi:hypothetical protein